MKSVIGIGALLVIAALIAPAAMATPAVLEFELDENYSELAPHAGDEALAEGEIDPNALAEGEQMPLPKGDVADAPAAPAADTAPDAPAAPAALSPEPAPAPVAPAKPVKAESAPAKPEAREIPLIDTQRESRSHEDVTFVTGGIGEEEREMIEASKGDYNLHITSASANGAFVGEARVVITRKKGEAVEEMLSVSAGPLLYVRLPSGHYTLEATLGEQTKKQNFSVLKKGPAARMNLSWKVSATRAE